MDTLPATNRYKNHRFPVELINHAVWLYFRFCLSFRDVEELRFERGVGVTYEAIRQWCRKVGQHYANQLRRRRPRPGDKWHMDEVLLTIKGERHYLWRAVDQEGTILVLQRDFIDFFGHLWLAFIWLKAHRALSLAE
jgi:putative transposase